MKKRKVERCNHVLDGVRQMRNISYEIRHADFIPSHNICDTYLNFVFAASASFCKTQVLNL
jgi:hypothetical protein